LRVSGYWRERLTAVGPGVLFAGAAIGVSHLVQSTRAGATYGFALLWAVLLVLVCKYPFFEYSHRFTVATERSLLDGYTRLGRPVLAAFMVVVVASAFITTAAVTVVTAGLMGVLFGVNVALPVLSGGLLAVVLLLLALGHYQLLDRGMKVMVLILGIMTLVAVGLAFCNWSVAGPAPPPPDLWTLGGMTFLLALIMHGGQVELASTAVAFSNQLVQMYTSSLGSWNRPLISLVAFIAMFSTTITVVDGHSRTLDRGLLLLCRRLWSPDSISGWYARRRCRKTTSLGLC